MQGFLSAPATRRGGTRTPPATRRPFARTFARFLRFIADDRDRWVPMVCAAGFTLLIWIDWLAA